MLAAQKPLELQVYHTLLRNIRSLLEKALRDFDFVAGLQLYVERRILPEPPDVINRNLRTTEKTNMPLVGKIVEPTGRVNRGQ